MHVFQTPPGLIFMQFLNTYISLSESTQLEDPRQEWRAVQEAMLRDYLQTAQDVLEVRLQAFNLCYIRTFFASQLDALKRFIIFICLWSSPT